MKLNKSSRHKKILGNFGEQLVANWLSRSGWEVLLVDHTGIDLIAYHSKSNIRIGVSVKSRARTEGKEAESVHIYDDNDKSRIMSACSNFACEPWIALYIETADSADLFLTSIKHYEIKYLTNANKVKKDWRMRAMDIVAYKNDPSVHHIRITFDSNNWFE